MDITAIFIRNYNEKFTPIYLIKVGYFKYFLKGGVIEMLV